MKSLETQLREEQKWGCLAWQKKKRGGGGWRFGVDAVEDIQALQGWIWMTFPTLGEVIIIAYCQFLIVPFLTFRGIGPFVQVAWINLR